MTEGGRSGRRHEHRHDADARWLRRAARLAIRGHGGAEPNPMVGCVIVDGDGKNQRLLGEGFHHRVGAPHAEREAIADAMRRAARAARSPAWPTATADFLRGATMYVTLEPCNGIGRTGPCTHAIIEAGIARVVVARRDPHAKGSHGLERLRDAGVLVDVVAEPRAVAVAEPFVHRVTKGLPWVIAKWAQTIDGCVATGDGQSKWISCERSRAMVHRERGRVDAILTGIGTVLADDPRLTARNVRLRRVARRVVVDPALRIPLDSALIATLDAAPLTVACRHHLANEPSPKARELARRGVEVVALPPDGSAALAPMLRHLVERHGTASVLVEAGPSLLGSLFDQRLVNEAWVFTAPIVLGDEKAMHCVTGRLPRALSDAHRMHVVDLRRRGTDTMTRWRVVAP